MSQVIVTKDSLSDKRQRSRDQEGKIITDDQFSHWRRSDATKRDPIAMMAAAAFTPVLAGWSFILACIVAMGGAVNLVFAVLGKIFPSSSSRTNIGQ